MENFQILKRNFYENFLRFSKDFKAEPLYFATLSFKIQKPL